MIYKSRRVKSLPVTADCLVRLFQELDGRAIWKADGMPADAECIGIMAETDFHAARLNRFRLFIESETFEPIEDGAVPPEMTITFSLVDRPAPLPKNVRG